MTLKEKERIERYNSINPIIREIKKDTLTLELRKFGYCVLLSNGKAIKSGTHLTNDLREYFEVEK